MCWWSNCRCRFVVCGSLNLIFEINGLGPNLYWLVITCLTFNVIVRHTNSNQTRIWYVKNKTVQFLLRNVHRNQPSETVTHSSSYILRKKYWYFSTIYTFCIVVCITCILLLLYYQSYTLIICTYIHVPHFIDVSPVFQRVATPLRIVQGLKQNVSMPPVSVQRTLPYMQMLMTVSKVRNYDSAGVVRLNIHTFSKMPVKISLETSKLATLSSCLCFILDGTELWLQ